MLRDLSERASNRSEEAGYLPSLAILGQAISNRQRRPRADALPSQRGWPL